MDLDSLPIQYSSLLRMGSSLQQRFLRHIHRNPPAISLKSSVESKVNTQSCPIQGMAMNMAMIVKMDCFILTITFYLLNLISDSKESFYPSKTILPAGLGAM